MERLIVFGKLENVAVVKERTHGVIGSGMKKPRTGLKKIEEF